MLRRIHVFREECFSNGNPYVQWEIVDSPFKTCYEVPLSVHLGMMYRALNEYKCGVPYFFMLQINGEFMASTRLVKTGIWK